MRIYINLVTKQIYTPGIVKCKPWCTYSPLVPKRDTFMLLKVHLCSWSFGSSRPLISNATKISGSQDLRAPEDRIVRSIHPSIVETLPEEFPDLKHEFSKLESQMFDRPKRPGLVPLTPVLPDANDRILTPGYAYNPVHTEIYGTYR